MAESPDLGALLSEVMDATKGSMFTAIPAQVVSYDAAKQAVTAKPVVSGRFKDYFSDDLLPMPLPAIANVPVCFPSGGGFSITWPLVAGDMVYLVIADRSIDEWKNNGNAENLPVDTRRFNLTDAVAIPGLRPFSSPLEATSVNPSVQALVLAGSDVRIGSSAATSAVALAPLLEAFLATLKVWMDTHIHAGVTSGAATSGPPAVPSPAPGTLGAVKVKAE